MSSEKLYRTTIVVWTRVDPREQGWDLLAFHAAEAEGVALVSERTTTLEEPTDTVRPEMIHDE